MLISYRESTDDILVRSAQGGDTRAFDELVRRYQDKVYRLANGILRHEDDAAEALQDAFLSAYRNLGHFRAESSFSTWLYRIATNASLMKYRKRRGNLVSLDHLLGQGDESGPSQLPDWAAQPPEVLLTAETREVMEEGLRRLPVDLRTVFVLRAIEGLSSIVASAILGLSVAAVKSRLHRARLFLRDWMTRHFDDPVTRSPTRPASIHGPSHARFGSPSPRAALARAEQEPARWPAGLTPATAEGGDRSPRP